LWVYTIIFAILGYLHDESFLDLLGISNVLFDSQSFASHLRAPDFSPIPPWNFFISLNCYPPLGPSLKVARDRQIGNKRSFYSFPGRFSPSLRVFPLNCVSLLPFEMSSVFFFCYPPLFVSPVFCSRSCQLRPPVLRPFPSLVVLPPRKVTVTLVRYLSDALNLDQP